MCGRGLSFGLCCGTAVAAAPPPRVEARSGGRRWLELAGQPRFIAAVVGAVASWGIMSLLMNATPLSMERHHHPFGDTTWVIQWHVLGMYVPAFFTGHLIRRFGEIRIMLAGLGLNLLAALNNLSGVELNHYLVGLTLLGVGWNFLFVGATSLLTHTYADNERARVQAANDFTIFAVMVLSSYGAGPLEGSLGWFGLNQLALPIIAVATLVIAWFGTRKPVAVPVPATQMN